MTLISPDYCSRSELSFSADNTSIVGHSDLTLGSHNIAASQGSIVQVTHIHSEESSYPQRPTSDHISHWLCSCSVNYRRIHDTVNSKRVPGTGLNLFESDEYHAWVESDQQIYQNIECRGGPGAGKTSTASEVIERLQELTKPKEEDIYLLNRYLSGFFRSLRSYVFNATERPDSIVLYVYFKEDAQSSQTVPIVFANLLSQVVQQQERPSEAVLELYREHHSIHGSTPVVPRLDKTAVVLKSELAAYKRVYIIVDALDEYRADNYSRSQSLVTELEQLNAKLFITSRHAVGFEPGTFTCLNVSADQGDIEKLVERLRKNQHSLADNVNRSPELVQEIVDVVTSRSKAQLFLDGISGLLTPNDIRAALRTLPKGLHETYGYTIKRILSQRAEIVQLAFFVIAWVLHARRPLTAMELRCAVASHHLQFERKHLPEDDLIGEDVILSACAGLVVFVDVAGDRIAEFVHSTTKGYLHQSSSKYLPEAERGITEACVRYLLNAAHLLPTVIAGQIIESSDPSDSPLHHLHKQFPLCDYAASSWGVHARNVGEMFDRQLAADLSQHQLLPYMALASDIGIYPTADMPPQQYYKLYLARFDLCTLLREHCFPGDPETRADEQEYRPRRLAIEDDCPQASSIAVSHDVVRATMMTQEADALSTQSPVSAAEETDAVEIDVNADIVEIEVDEETDYCIQPSDYDSEDIACNKTIEMDTLRLGCDPVHPGTLLDAVAIGNAEEVGRLLDEGTEPTGDGTGAGITGITGCVVRVKNLHLQYALRLPLSRAAAMGHMEIVKMLLAKGADPNIQTTHTSSAIMIQFSDVSAENLHIEYFAPQSPLSYAAACGQLQMVRLLLDEGADPNGLGRLETDVNIDEPISIRRAVVRAKHLHVQYHASRAPLSCAAAGGHIAIVRLLLERGANPDTSINGTGISIAASVVEADEFHLKYYASRSPISCAAAGGHVEMVKMLLDKGANADVEVKADMSKVMSISRCTFDATDLRIEYEVGQGPLSYAAARGDVDIVRMLLEKGANPDVCRGRTLFWELTGSMVSARTLQLKPYSGKTPLDHAAASHAGVTDIANILDGNANRHEHSRSTRKQDKLLVQWNAAPNLRIAFHVRQRPLCHAAACGNVSIARMLLGAGASPVSRVDEADIGTDLVEGINVMNISPNKLETPIVCAIAGGHREILRTLLTPWTRNKRSDLALVKTRECLH